MRYLLLTIIRKALLLVTLFAFSTNLVKANSYYPRKIVMEEATGTWCGWCVRGIETIERMKEQYPDNFIAIGLHSGDAMSTFYNYESITSQFTSYPSCIFNRNSNGVVSVSLNGAQSVVAQYKDNAIAKIEATASFVGTNKQQVKVKTSTTFGFSSNAAAYRIAYAVLEDNVGPYKQKNYYSNNENYSNPNNYMYGWYLKDPSVEIYFNDVARGIYSTADGVAGSVPTSLTEGQAYAYEYTLELPDNISNKDNIRIVTLLIDSSTGEIVNADQTTIGEGSDNPDPNIPNPDTITLKGNGTYDNPYLIGTAEELKEFNSLLADNDGLCAKLTADIVLNTNVLNADYSLNGNGSNFEQWTPHGIDNGYFNGCGHTISGLYINNSKEYQAFFESASRIDSLGIVDSYIKAYRHAGGICSWLRHGDNIGGKISSCYFDGVVIATGDKAGGISAHMGNTYEGGPANCIVNCYNRGHISGYNHVGGICGSAYSLTSTNSDYIENCYNIGVISAEWTDCGDISGYADNAQGSKVSAAASKCYSLSGVCSYKGEGYTGTIMSLNDFHNGSVCTLLNNGGGKFHQTIGVDEFPRLFGESVNPNPDDNNDYFGTVADAVDLGLSVKWASWNVGADKPEGLGNLYAWGELSPKTDYSTSTYKFYSGGYTKYGSVDNKYRLDSEDDVAQQKWGDKWRMPTYEELKELKDKCTFTKTELNGVPVTKVTGPNGNFIYFPYPGNFTGTSLYFKNSIGSYWSSDLQSDSYAKDLDFRNGMPDLNGDSRYHGQSVRPVYEDNNDVPLPNDNGTVPDVVDLGLTSGTLWAAWNIGASSPEEYGTYFAWGETAPKRCYDWSTYKFGDGSNFSKYNSTDGLTELELEDDAAYVILGKDWRMPTHKEELELVNECSWESVTVNGISGYKITGPNGNSIFMPRGGLYDGTDYDCDGTKLSSENYGGWYWSTTLNAEGSAYAQGLCFFPSLLSNVSDHERCDGHNIRPVHVKSLTPIDDNGGVDYGDGNIDDDTDLNGNVIGNIYYNISDENGEYSSTEGCITLRKSTSDSDMDNLEGQDIFGEDFKNGFTGIVFMVQAGQGTIKINAESVGNMTLKVKIGSNAPMTFELEGKMKASIPYSVTEPTYVYIYGGETTANASGLRAASSDNALKIYGIEWSGESTSIESINRDVETNAIIYNLNGQRVNTPSKGIYIKNGKKYLLK